MDKLKRLCGDSCAKFKGEKSIDTFVHVFVSAGSFHMSEYIQEKKNCAGKKLEMKSRLSSSFTASFMAYQSGRRRSSLIGFS